MWILINLFVFLLWEYLSQGLGRTGGQLQMNQWSLRNNRLNLETLGELWIILEESIKEYTLNE